jgi:uncharacterized protein YbaR (Trm112 family)
VTLHPMLLEILVCPDCKGAVTVDSTNSELVCDDCGLVYPIRDGIPIMLISEARRPDAAGSVGSVDSADDAADTADTASAADNTDAAVEPTDD